MAHLSNLTLDEAVELGSAVGALIGPGIEGEEGVDVGAQAAADAAGGGVQVFSDEDAWDVLDDIWARSSPERSLLSSSVDDASSWSLDDLRWHRASKCAVRMSNGSDDSRPTSRNAREERAMPLLDLFWSMLWFFLWIVWFWLLITIFADIFRSEDLSGWGKALWVAFTVFLPYLGVFVYLIARGQSMHERAQRHALRSEQAARTYIKDVAGQVSPSEELARLAQLRDAGTLSDEEFQAQKAKVLAA